VFPSTMPENLSSIVSKSLPLLVRLMDTVGDLMDEEAKTSFRKHFYWVGVTVVFLLFFFACFHGVANYWQWGHNGYNGAAFSQAARNSLRFGVAFQAQYHTGLSRPGIHEAYTDHPMMLHFHLMIFQWLFGPKEWAGRLVPAIYSFLSLVVLFLMVRRLGGPGMALLSIALFTLTPLNLIFANMIDHEQGCIFWCLVFLNSYCLWLKNGRWLYGGLCLLSITLAAQFDWPAYYLAFFVAAHAFVSGFLRQPRKLQWKKEYTWIAFFSAVVLANFFGFFLYVSWLRGGVSEMMNAFFWRSSHQAGTIDRILFTAKDLYGPILEGLLVLWVLQTLFGAVRRKLGMLDWVPILFFMVQVIHSSVFQNAGMIHSYWIYYLGPVIAVGGAIVLTELWRLQKEKMPKGGTTFVLAILACLLIWQTSFSWKQLRWGFSTGNGAYVHDYDDQFAEISWAKELGRLFPRSKTHYFIHRSVFNWRIEFLYYLDAPYFEQSSLVLPAAGSGLPEHPEHKVLLLDLNHLPDRDVALTFLKSVTERGAVKIWDRRFVAIDSHGLTEALEAFLSWPEKASIGWRWLVNPDRPPVRWERDPEINKPEDLLGREVARSQSEQKGGIGGDGFQWSCSMGQMLDQLVVQPDSSRDSAVVAVLQPRCHNVSKINSIHHESESSPLVGPFFGWVRSSDRISIRCEDSEFPVGVSGRSGALLDAVGLVCAPPDLNEKRMTNLVGGKGGTSFELLCPSGQVLTGFNGRKAQWIHSLGIQCAER
jgi:4-amino-4-deoxy-L-arabinose transferase-like glycosyltransferase